MVEFSKHKKYSVAFQLRLVAMSHRCIVSALSAYCQCVVSDKHHTLPRQSKGIYDAYDCGMLLQYLLVVMSMYVQCHDIVMTM